MATILNAYNLAGGDTLSSEVATPNNVRLHYKLTGATNTAQVVKMTWQVKDGSGGYVDLKDEWNRTIARKIIGNDEGSMNVLGINSSSLKINVDVQAGAAGTLSLYTNES